MESTPPLTTDFQQVALMGAALVFIVNRGIAGLRLAFPDEMTGSFCGLVAVALGPLTALTLKWASISVPGFNPIDVSWPVTLVVGSVAGFIAMGINDWGKNIVEDAQPRVAAAKVAKRRRKAGE